MAEADSFGDPLTAPFWAAARRREFVIRRCASCGAHTYIPRPFCLGCGSDDVAWVAAKGFGTVYSMTVVRRQASPEFATPYVNAIVELDEGPRLLTNIVGGECRIGDRVRIDWRERANAPPLPVFTPVGSAG